MKQHWTCRAQGYLVKHFPNASQRIRLPKWMWRRLCAADCSDQCLTTCVGCRELAEELQPRHHTTAPVAEAPTVQAPAPSEPTIAACGCGPGCCGEAEEAAGSSDERESRPVAAATEV